MCNTPSTLSVTVRCFYYVVCSVSAFLALTCLFANPRAQVLLQLVQAATAEPTITFDGAAIADYGSGGSVFTAFNAKLDAAGNTVLMADIGYGLLIASATPYSFLRRRTSQSSRMCTFDGNEVSSPSTSNVYCRRNDGIYAGFLAFKFSDLSIILDGSSNPPLYRDSSTLFSSRGLMTVIPSTTFMFVTTARTDGTIWRIDISSFTFTGTVTSSKSAQDSSATSDLYRYGACDTTHCYSLSTNKNLVKFSQGSAGVDPAYVSTLDLNVAGQLDSGTFGQDSPNVVIDTINNNLIVTTTGTVRNIAKIDLGTFTFTSRLAALSNAVVLLLCDNCWTAGNEYLMVISRGSSKDARFIKISDMTEVTTVGTFVNTADDTTAGYISQTSNAGAVFSNTGDVQKLTTTGVVPVPASLTLTQSRSASVSLQSLTRTSTISKTASPQSLTATRTASVTRSSSTSASLVSLTATKSISKSASLQSLTKTKTHSVSPTQQSLTRTISTSKSSSLQSLTSTRSLSTSSSLQSQTNTHTVSSSKTTSASSTLRSLTATKSSSKSASLQSLTKTPTRSISRTLLSLTTTISRSKSASLQSLTDTRTISASKSVQSLTATRSISSSASLQSLTLTCSLSKSSTLLSLTNTLSRSSSATPFSRSNSLSLISLTQTQSRTSTKSSTVTSSKSTTTSHSLQSLTATMSLFSRSSTLSSTKTTSKTATFTLPPTPSRTRSLTVTRTKTTSLQSLSKTKTSSRSLQSLSKTKSKTSLVTPPPTTTTTTAAPGDNVINNLPPSSNILNALVVSVPSCPSTINSKCQVRHPQSNECRCPQNTYEQNITLLPSFTFLPSTSPTSQLIDQVGNPCVRNEFILGICTASTSERFISSYTRSGGTTSENGICEEVNPFTSDCSCRSPSTKAPFAIATGSSATFNKKFVTFCLPSNGDLSVFWTIHPDVATSSSTSSNRAQTSCVSPNGNVTCECAAGASKTSFGASIFPDASSTDPVPGDLTFCKAKPAEPEEEVNFPITITGTAVGIVGGFIEGGGANAVVGIQVAALLMTLCDNNPNVSTSGAKSVVVFFQYPGLDPSLGGLAFMLTLTLGVFTLHALLCLLFGFKRFTTTEPIEFDPDRIDFFEDEIESPTLIEQVRFASLQLRFPHWSFFVMNIGFSGVVVESTILLQDTESDVNVLIGSIGLVFAIIYMALTLYYSYWGLRSVAPQKLFDIVESDQLLKMKKEKKKLKKEKKKLKKALNEVAVIDDDEATQEDVDSGFPPDSSRRSRSSSHQRSRSRQHSQSSPVRNVASSRRRSSRAQSSSRSKKNSRSSNAAVTPRSFNGSSSSDDDDSDTDTTSSSSSGAEEEDGHKWFSRRKSIHSPSAASSKRRQLPVIKQSKTRLNTASPIDTKKSPTDDRASSAVQMPANDGADVDEDDSKKHSVIIEDAKNGEFLKEESDDMKQPAQKIENSSSTTKAQTAIQKKINKRQRPRQSRQRGNPLRAPPRRTMVDEDTSSAEENLDLDDEGEEEEQFDGSSPKDTVAEEEEEERLTEDDKPPHYVKYGKAIQMFAKYCGAAKYFLSDGWWIKFRLYNRRYASMYNSFQPRPTAWAPTIVRVFMFSVSIASSLGGCVIPLTYVGTVALLIAIFFLGSRPCRRPFDNLLLALQLILAATLAFSRSSDPELSVNLFYGVIAVTFVYVFHICLMESLENFSMSALELDAREK